MAKPIVATVIKAALRESFDRYHLHCDHCGDEFEYFYGNLFTTERDNIAGSFKYTLCGACCRAMRKMSESRRQRATTNAIIRHAAHYSHQFAGFVARWYGVGMPRRTDLLARMPERMRARMLAEASEGQ